jgi:DNA mismatch repair protein MSH6
VAARDHPDARAIMYENATYGKRKINDLLQALRAFDTAERVRALFHAADGETLLTELGTSPMLVRTLHTRFPRLRPLLAFFKRAFDFDEAKRTGNVTPAAGVDPRFDQAEAEIKAVKGEAPWVGERGGGRAAHQPHGTSPSKHLFSLTSPPHCFPTPRS